MSRLPPSRKRLLVFGLLGLLVAVQLGVTLYLLGGKRALLRDGHAFLFQTAPIEPASLFDGKYLDLQLTGDTLPLPAGLALQPNQPVCARVGADPDGFARVVEVSLEPPADDARYFRTFVRRLTSTEVQVYLPFDRYYRSLRLAPQAEQSYRQRTAGRKVATALRVRISAGKAAVEELYLEGLSLADHVRRTVAAPTEPESPAAPVG